MLTYLFVFATINLFISTACCREAIVSQQPGSCVPTLVDYNVLRTEYPDLNKMHCENIDVAGIHYIQCLVYRINETYITPYYSELLEHMMHLECVTTDYCGRTHPFCLPYIPDRINMETITNNPFWSMIVFVFLLSLLGTTVCVIDYVIELFVNVIKTVESMGILLRFYFVVLASSTAWASVYIDASNGVPYWPIEISRTASGECGYSVFLFGVTGLVLLVSVRSLSNSYRKFFCVLIPMTGAFTLACFDDVRFIELHTLGLIIMLVGTFIFSNFYAPDYMRLLFCMGILFSIRVALKVIVVSMYELNDQDVGVINMLYRFITFDTDFMDRVKSRSLDIMMSGNWRNGLWTQLVFKLGGVLQWIVLFVCAGVYDKKA